MPIAAAPLYLNSDFAEASPGLRFGLYLAIWSAGRDANNKPGAIRDKKNRWEKDIDQSDQAWSRIVKLTADDTRRMQALGDRQTACAHSIRSGEQILSLDSRAVAPFTTGLGNEHPLENGFAFLDPYGLPYLSGSGVKGVLRQAARELAGLSIDAQWNSQSDWTEETITALFGSEDSNAARRGALGFWDVIPQISGNKLMVEIMTAHQTHYYRGEEAPHESGLPTPIKFLSVPPNSQFTFHVICDKPFLTLIAPRLADNDQWKTLLQQAFEHAFQWLGFGAKTAVGYGAMARDRAAEEKRREEAEARRAEEEKQRRIERETAGLPADAKSLERIRHAGNWQDNSVFLNEAEKLLEQTEPLSAQAHTLLMGELEARWPGITADPAAVRGRQRKPKYKQRPRALSERLIGGAPENSNR